MSADEARRQEIANAAKRLESFLQTLGPDGLSRQSACEGWTVGDVVGHLIERGNPIPDQIERGLAGDISAPPDALDDPPPSEDQFRLDLDRRAVELRRELGDGLAPEFARVNREFDRVLDLVQPDDWDKLCYHRLRPETVRSKVDIRIAELAMHEWDIHWAFDPNASLVEDSLPGLVSASGRAVRRAFRPDSLLAGRPLRYRFQITHPQRRALDLVLSDDVAQITDDRCDGPSESADVTFECDGETCVLVMYGRLAPSAAVGAGRLSVVAGETPLVATFGDRFVGG